MQASESVQHLVVAISVNSSSQLCLGSELVIYWNSTTLFNILQANIVKLIVTLRHKFYSACNSILVTVTVLTNQYNFSFKNLILFYRLVLSCSKC